MPSLVAARMDPYAKRKEWMRLLAHAHWAELEPLLGSIEFPSDIQWLRLPETGMAMVRARAGGTGMAFNMGEATVTRCAVQLADGKIGHSYILGRNGQHSRAAALIDALMQMPDREGETRARIIEPLRLNIDARRNVSSRKAAATRVDFFTLVRGED